MAAVAGDDFYARIAAFAADVVALDLQQLKEVESTLR